MTSFDRTSLVTKIIGLMGASTLAVLISLPGFTQTTHPGSQDTDRPGRSEVSPNTQNTPGTTDQAPVTDTTLDRKFIIMAAQGNNAEIQTSQLALERATDENVRQYAQRMIEEHTTANQALEPLAAKQGITLPNTPSSFDMAVLERLAQIPEAEFDRAYMDTQVNAHLKSLAVFRTGAQQVEDVDLQNYATTLLPTIQDHLAIARQMTEGSTNPGTPY